MFGNLATIPKEMMPDKSHRNAIVYGNITKFINDTTDCLYQTNPIIIESDIALKSQRACRSVKVVQVRLCATYNPKGRVSIYSHELCSLLVDFYTDFHF